MIDASFEQVTYMTCIGTNAKGGPCQTSAMRGSRYCYFHDPEMKAARLASQARGGRNRSYSTTPGSLLYNFDLRDRDMRIELLNFALSQVFSNRMEPSAGFLVIQATNIARAEQAAAEAVKELATVPTDKRFDLPLLQLPETSVREILGSYTEPALQALYDQIIAYEELKPADGPANHDSPKDERADSSAAGEPDRQKTSIQFLKAAVIYFLDKYFWDRSAEEAARYVPGYISSYRQDGTEFLGLREEEVRMRLSGFEPEALEDLLRAIDKLEEHKSEEAGRDSSSSESIPLSLYGNGHVTPELLKKMANFFLDEKKKAIEERLSQRRLYEEQFEREFGAVASTPAPRKNQHE
jgi:hypothetical protein